jgi:hypothetical protein
MLAEFTELEWLMLCHARERMGMEGDPSRAQAYFGLAEDVGATASAGSRPRLEPR